MTERDDDSPAADDALGAKVSRDLAARLLCLGPTETIRTVVVLSPDGAAPPLRPEPRVDRRATIAARRKALEPAVADVDRILEGAGGRRLAPEVDALGTIPVETTAEGAMQLAASAHVKAILEDQPIALLPPPSHE